MGKSKTARKKTSVTILQPNPPSNLVQKVFTLKKESLGKKEGLERLEVDQQQ